MILVNFSVTCGQEGKVVNKMCSRGRMRAGGREIQGETGDWITRRGKNEVNSEDIFIFILVF